VFEIPPNKLLTEFGQSTEFRDLLMSKTGTATKLAEITNQLTYKIIQAAERVKLNYNQALLDFNSNAKTSRDSCFLTPNIKTNARHNRTYITLRWAQLMNKAYMGHRSNERNWQIREIKRRGKTHYSERDFASLLNGGAMSFLPRIMETEHQLRFLREQYLAVGDLFSISRAFQLSERHRLLSMAESEHTDKEQIEKYKKLKLQVENGEIDPLQLPKKLSLFEPSDQFLTEEELEAFDGF